MEFLIGKQWRGERAEISFPLISFTFFFFTLLSFTFFYFTFLYFLFLYFPLLCGIIVNRNPGFCNNNSHFCNRNRNSGYKKTCPYYS